MTTASTNANIYNPRSPPPENFLSLAPCSFKLSRQTVEIFHQHRRHRRHPAVSLSSSLDTDATLR